MATSQRILVMGVSGSGKSRVGRLLAERLGIPYIDGDDHHLPSSIAKMSRGIPLDDEDRQEWLEILSGLFDEYRRRAESVVIGCSALKRRYRDILRRGDPALRILYLRGDRDQLRRRLTEREGHFFKGETLLDGQLRDLQPPGEEEAVTLNIALSPEAIVEEFMQAQQ